MAIFPLVHVTILSDRLDPNSSMLLGGGDANAVAGIGRKSGAPTRPSSPLPPALSLTPRPNFRDDPLVGLLVENVSRAFLLSSTTSLSDLDSPIGAGGSLARIVSILQARNTNNSKMFRCDLGGGREASLISKKNFVMTMTWVQVEKENLRTCPYGPAAASPSLLRPPPLPLFSPLLPPPSAQRT